MAYAIIFVSAIGGVAMPAINTITSTLTPRNAQGELQGAQASMMAFTLIFSPVLMTQTLEIFRQPAGRSSTFTQGGAAFLLAGVITRAGFHSVPDRRGHQSPRNCVSRQRGALRPQNKKGGLIERPPPYEFIEVRT